MVAPSSNKPLRLAPACGVSIFLLVIASLLAGWATSEARSEPATIATQSPTNAVFLPWVSGPPVTPTPARVYLPSVHNTMPPVPTIACPASSTAQWGEMAPQQNFIAGAAQSPDTNLNVRGWYRVNAPLGFTRYPYPTGEPPDGVHPLYLSNIVPGANVAFVSAYQVHEWDWFGCNCGVPRSPLPYPVTMLGLRSTPGQPLHIAGRDLTVDPQGFTAMVLYADAGQLALKYTWDDRVDTGYIVHLVNLCVDPNLIVLYDRLNREGRHKLPGVYNHSVVGIAQGGEVAVAVRDSGSFLDPRSWQDWWQDQLTPASWVH